MSIQNLPAWTMDQILRGQAVLFLGSGASIGAKGRNGEQPLSGNQLRDRLSDKFLSGELKDKSLAHVAELSKNESSLRDVQNLIYENFEPLYPADFHYLLPKFRWHAILTTNYDLIVERAYHGQKDRLQEVCRIIRDGDKFGDAISGLQTVPFLKLHGCLTVINDPALPLILASEEYAKHRLNRERLFRHFQDWSKDYPVIFCGYDLADPNIQQILYEIGDDAVNRQQFVLVRPDLTAIDERYWSARRVVPIKATYEEFLNHIDHALPNEKRVLSVLIKPTSSSFEPHISRGQPSDLLRLYIEKEIDHVRRSMPTTGVKPSEFYRGAGNDWNAIQQELDIPRRVTDELLIEAVLDAPSTRKCSLFLVKGHAGSGKSVTLRRAAWNAAIEHNAFVLWVRDGGLIRPDLIRELCSLTDDRIFLFIDDAITHMETLRDLVRTGTREKLRLTIILGARTNEWNVSGGELDHRLQADYELRDLSNREIDELLQKLESAKCLGELTKVEPRERNKYFVLSAERQLLVALHEATLGESFEKIVLNEYQNVAPKEAQTLYLDVCTLHRFRVGVRAGLISRVSGVTFEYFGNQLLKPLEHVITVYFDSSSRDYAFKTRHTLIADLVFRQAFDDQEDRSIQLVRIVRSMNTDYESDKKAFEQLIKGKDLAELFSDRVLADRIFEAAVQSGASKSHVAHQKAIFELHHPGGNLVRAMRAVDEAIHDAGYMKQAVLHTKAMILRKQALESDSALAQQKLRDDAKNILRRQIRQGKRPHPFHTLGQLLKDEVRELLQKPSEESGAIQIKNRIIADLLMDLEKVIEAGLQRFPGESYLLGLEADLAALLQDSPRAQIALIQANKINPENGHIAVRLARVLDRNGESERSAEVLRKCIEVNPTARLVRVAYAKMLRAHDEEGNQREIRNHLRSGFTDGDTNYETQFWFARAEYLYGDIDVANRIFAQLEKASVSPDTKNRKRGVISNRSGEPKIFEGTVTALRDAFCFVRVPEFKGDVFVHHSQVDPTEWANFHHGSTVSFSVAFCFRGVQGIDAHLS